MLKRILSLTVLLCITLSFSITPASYAEAGAVLVKIDDLLKDENGWSAAKEDIAFKNSSLEHTNPAGKTSVFGYKNKKFANEIVEFDAIFNFVDTTNWQGFMIRSADPDYLPWKWEQNKNYLIVVTENQLELQRFNYKSEYLGVAKTPFKSGERVHIQYGAMNTEKGVQIILKINGKTIFNVIDDSEAAVKDPGYFGLYNKSFLQILPYTGKAAEEAPSAILPKLEGKGTLGEKIKAEYTYNDLQGGKEGKSEYSWYRTLTPVDKFGYGRTQLYPSDFREKHIEKIEGATNSTYTITSQDLGFYIFCGIKPKSKANGLLGEEIFTNTIHVDNIKNILLEGIYFVADCPYAVSFGSRVLINENNENIAPFEENGEFYIPLEFTAKNMGCTVKSNTAKKTWSVLKNSRNIKTFKEEDVVLREATPFIPISNAQEIFSVKSEFEPFFDVAIMNDGCAGLNPIDYRVLYRIIKKAVLYQ